MIQVYVAGPINVDTADNRAQDEHTAHRPPFPE